MNAIKENVNATAPSRSRLRSERSRLRSGRARFRFVAEGQHTTANRQSVGFECFLIKLFIFDFTESALRVLGKGRRERPGASKPLQQRRAS
jgi:hypothetical protein